MTFPLVSIPATFIRPAPTVTYIGRNLNTGDGFPTGAQTFTSGLKLIVVCCEPAGSPQASGVTVGGVAMTQAAQTGVQGGRSASVWYLETTASGSLTISGSGGSGRSALDAYEVRGYRSATPYFTGTAVTGSGTSMTIDVPTSTNTIVLGAGTGGFTTMSVSANIGPVPTVVTVAYESATSHFSWYQTPTARGTTTFTASGGVTTSIDLAVAAWR